MILSCATKKDTVFGVLCVNLKERKRGIHFLAKMHFGKPYANKLTTAFASCPNPIQSKALKRCSSALPAPQKKDTVFGVLCGAGRGIRTPVPLGKRFSRLVSHLELNGN